MKLLETELLGVVILEPDIYSDERGFFTETWNQSKYERLGLPTGFVQDNMSYSTAGVLRGLHYQHPNPQGKLVQVIEGEVFDVAVDIRRGSPTFGKWVGVMLDSSTRRQLFIPEGFAHGFCVTSEHALFAYKCTVQYHPDCDRGVLWNDTGLGIDWPVVSPIVSAKDSTLRPLEDIPSDLLPFFG